MKLPTIAKSRKMVLWGCVCILYGAALGLSSDKSQLSQLFFPGLIWSIVLGRAAERLGYSLIFWIAAGIGGGVLAAVPLWEHGSLWRNRWTRALGMIAFVLFLGFAAQQQLEYVLDPTKERDPNALMGMGVVVAVLSVLWLAGIVVEALTRRLKGRLAFPRWHSWKDYRVTYSARVGLGIAAILVIGILWWWWLRPPPESLTQRLWRECLDTMAYTHPEWSKSHLDTMAKGCMDQRLLRQ